MNALKNAFGHGSDSHDNERREGHREGHHESHREAKVVPVAAAAPVVPAKVVAREAPVADRSVDQHMAAAVVHEHIQRQEQEDVQTVIDKDKHQDVYHTTVQPVQDKEVLAQRHQYQQAAVQNREFDHDDKKRVEARLAEEQAQFRNTRSEAEIQHTHVVEPELVTEHKHVHVHETIQPVIEKEIIEQTVVHTTVPIHEVHHEASVFQGTTVAPAMTAEEFKKTMRKD